MVSPRGKRRKKDVFDVHAAAERGSLASFLKNIAYERNLVNLRPKFRARHPLLWAVIVVIAVGGVALGIKKIFTRAEVNDFYPSTCLGTWQNPANAEGKPETLAAASSSPSGANSAVYTASDTQIYCGGFVPRGFAQQGTITSIGLTLAWRVGDGSESTSDSAATSAAVSIDQASTSATIATTTVATTTTEATPIVPIATPTTATSTIATSTDTVASTTAASSTQSSFTPFRWFSLFTNTAFADDSSSVTLATTTVTTANGASDTVQLAPPLTAALAPVTSSATSSITASGAASSSGAAATTTIVIPSPSPPPAPPAPKPDQNFLDVSYSTDGQMWIELQKVNAQNWPNFTTAIPVTNWADLANLQIRVQGIPTTVNPIPPVYLDGMFVEVNYSVPPPVFSAGQNGTSPSEPQVVQVSPGVTIETPPSVPALPIPAPTIVAINKATDTVSVTVQYVGDFYANPLYLFMYPQGTRAERNSSDSAYTFAGEPTEGSSVNPLSIAQTALDPATKQATFVIVRPGLQNDAAITTADMIPGIYAVDVSYYDGVTWHLTAPQTFTWP